MVVLRKFQLAGCRQIYRFGGNALVADEQGLGKTIEALFWIYKIPSRRPVVIVTPSSVKWNWQAEAMLHFGMRAQVIEGRCRNKNKKLRGQIFIINYDILASWLRPLKRIRPQVVIFDECQFIKTPTAQRTRAARKLASRAVSRLALSGTPLTNRPAELWSAVNIVRPDIFPDQGKFLWRYCEPRRTRWGWVFRGAKRLPELHRILKSECMIRRLKKDVLPELPDKIHKIVPFRLNSYTEYNRARDEFLAWLSSKSLARAKKARRSKTLTKIGYLLRLCAELKLPWIIRWLQDYAEANPGRKLVCMTMNTFVIDRLRREFPQSVVVNGSVRGKKRHEAVRKFQLNKQVQFFFGNWKAAGYGITLTSSNVLVSLDFPWSPGDLAQGQDRVHRIGQLKKVLIYYLVALHTIEEKLLRTLQKKSEVLAAVLDGQAESTDFDLLDVMLKEMKYEQRHRKEHILRGC